MITKQEPTEYYYATWMSKPGVQVNHQESERTCRCGVTFTVRAAPTRLARCPACRIKRKVELAAVASAKQYAKAKVARRLIAL